MSKRNKQQTMYQPGGPAKKRTTSAKSNVKTNGKRPQNSVSSKAHPSSTTHSAPPLPHSFNNWNLGIIRIAAIVIAVIAIAGGIAWASFIRTTQSGFTPIQVVGLIALGFVAGLAIAVAFRTGDIVAKVIQARRERAQRS